MAAWPNMHTAQQGQQYQPTCACWQTASGPSLCQAATPAARQSLGTVQGEADILCKGWSSAQHLQQARWAVHVHVYVCSNDRPAASSHSAPCSNSIPTWKQHATSSTEACLQVVNCLHILHTQHQQLQVWSGMTRVLPSNHKQHQRHGRYHQIFMPVSSMNPHACQAPSIMNMHLHRQAASR